MDPQPQSSPALLAAGLVVSLLAIGGMAYTGLQLGFVPGMQGSLSAAVSRTAPLKVISPNGGEVWTAGSTQNITWSGGAQSWKVSLLIMNEERTKTVNAIAPNVANTGSYAWTIPSDIPAGRYYLRAACTNCKSNVQNRTDFSDAPFIVAPAAPVNVVLSGTPSIQVTQNEGSSDTVTAKISFEVAAAEKDVWIAKKTAMSETPLKGHITQYYADGTTGIVSTAGDAVLVASGSTTGDSASGFKVLANTTRSFTLTITGTAHTTGVVGYKIVGIGYDTDLIVDTTSPVYSSGLADFKTQFVTATAVNNGPISISVISESAVSNDSDGADTGTFKIRYKLTAGGSPIYVSKLTTLGVGPRYRVWRAGSGSSINLSLTPATLVNLSTAATTPNGNYRIEAGQSQTFDLTVAVPVGQIGIADYYRLSLSDIYWDTDDDATPDQDYILPLLQTDYLYLDNG